jgi:carboxyl-terminal processing protease
MILSLTLALLVHAAAPARPDSTLAVATFDSAWSRVKHTYYDSTMRGVDWDAVRRELRPRAAAARTPRELRGVLQEMLARLGDSHLEVIPGEAAAALEAKQRESDGTRDGDIGAEVRLVEGALVVSSVERGSPAERAGVRPGWAVERIGTLDVPRMLAPVLALAEGHARRTALIEATMRANGLLAGEAGDTLALTLRDGAGRDHALRIARRASEGEIARFGNLPPMLVRFDAERRAIPGGGCAGVVRFNLWLLPIAARFDSAMRALRDCRGVVIDLRGNPGGVGALSMGIAGYFLDSTRALGTMRTRSGELRFVVNPRRADATGEAWLPYHGPVAIVVDPLSASTSEIFAAGMQQLGRVRIFGDESAGMALPAWITRLPNGDLLLHAIADYVLPDGRRVEGAGVIPDERVPLTRAGLATGRDGPLERAVAWIAAQGGGR